MNYLILLLYFIYVFNLSREAHENHEMQQSKSNKRLD